jgi:hypothetical protein
MKFNSRSRGRDRLYYMLEKDLCNFLQFREPLISRRQIKWIAHSCPELSHLRCGQEPCGRLLHIAVARPETKVVVSTPDVTASNRLCRYIRAVLDKHANDFRLYFVR